MEYELDEMRQQMAMLKEKLDNQAIVNDRFIRRSMRESVSTINKRYLIVSVLALVMIPYCYWAFVLLNGLSLGVWIAVVVMMLAVVGFCYFNGRALRDPELMNASLVEAKRRVTKAKKRDNDWLYVGIPMAMAWVVWVAYEMAQKTGSNAIVIGCVAGAIVGAFIGLKVHFKTQRHYSDVLEQIEELEKEA